MDVNYLLLSMLYSTIGLGMFIYGKKAVSFVPLIAGILLMIVPFFITSLLWMSIVSVILMASPFFIRSYEL
jgi:hypothetical protein